MTAKLPNSVAASSMPDQYRSRMQQDKEELEKINAGLIPSETNKTNKISAEKELMY